MREVRMEKGVAQEELAYLAGIHRTSMGMIERGKSVVSMYTAAKIAVALEMPLEELVAKMNLKED